MRAEHLHQETPPVVTVPGNAINRVCRVDGTKISTVSWQGRTHLPKPETSPTGSAAFACLEDSWSSKDVKEECSHVHILQQLQNKILRRRDAEPLCLQKESSIAWTLPGELKSGDCPSHSVHMGIVAHGRRSETVVRRDSKGINLSPAIRPGRDD